MSRSHRVALDWLFERINLDHKIHVKYVDTKNQLADMLTNGSFTRDAWNHNLRLCVQHHEFLDVFLQLFLFEQKAEHHVEENSRKEDGRRACGSVKKPERKSNPFNGFGCFIRHRETCARQGLPKRSKEMIIRVQQAQGNLC